jgi:Domain of unknown function (DUF4397)
VTLIPRTASGKRRRLAALMGATLVACVLSALAANPASAADVGYVRLAHLSPDTPDVDVYLQAVNGSLKQRFPGVGYGVVSKYLPLGAGTYAVAMRVAGAPESSPPVLTTQVTVTAGNAYTVAGVGKHADLGLRVISDDLALPASNKAKVRVIQASVVAPVLDVSVSGGENVATGVAFATTTNYQEVTPGNWTLQLKPAGSSSATTQSASLSAGGVYSVLVLDKKPSGLEVKVFTDAKGGGPVGAVETGAGGTAPRPMRFPVLLGLSLAVLFGVAAVGLWTRRRRVSRTL